MQLQVARAKNTSLNSTWGLLGPHTITKISRRLCTLNTTDWQWLSRDCGPNLLILPPASAYPVPYTEWKRIYDPNSSELVSQSWRESFAVHVWNHMRLMGNVSSGDVFREGSAMLKLMRENCPETAEARFHELD